MSKPLLIAHRGDTVHFPENTIEAFQSAFDKGADGVELDVQFGKGELLVIHNYLYDQSKNYPTLGNVLEQFAQKGRLEIEIKCMDLDFLSPLKQMLQKYENSDIEITTSVFLLVSYLRKEFPSTQLGIIFHEKEFEEWMPKEFIRTKVVQMMSLCKAQVAHIPPKFIDLTMVTECHSNSLKVHGHIHKKSMQEQVSLYGQFQEWGVDQCTFDDMALLERCL